MSRLEIDGWGVAQVDLERRWSGGDPADRCSLFRSATTWTLVTMRRSVNYDGWDQPSGEKATITTGEFSTIEELAREVERTYFAGAWVELLGAGYEHDSETYRAWVAERIRRDFDAASIHRKDLGSTLGCGGQAVPAPGCQLPGLGGRGRRADGAASGGAGL